MRQVLAEIYKFRARTLEYDVTVTVEVSQDATDEKKTEPLSQPEREKKVREIFVERVNAIYSLAMSSELSKGASLRHSKHAQVSGHACQRPPTPAVVTTFRIWQAQLDDDMEARDELHKRLLQHCDRNLYPKLRWSGADSSARLGGNNLASDDMDDLVSPLSIETYVQYRVAPLIANVEATAPMLANLQQGFEILAFFLNTVGGALAAFSLVEWVALSVSCSTVASSVLDYFNVSSRVVAYNAAVQDLHNMLTYWNGMSMIEHRTRACKEHVVNVAESASLSLIAASTNTTARVQENPALQHNEEEKKSAPAK
jgi:hypothetical protein